MDNIDTNHKLFGYLSEHVNYIQAETLYAQLRGRWPQINALTAIKDSYTQSLVINSMLDDYKMTIRHYRKQGRKARFWRIAGEFFNKSKWLERGWYHMQERELQAQQRTLEMSAFGVTFTDYLTGRPTSWAIRCAYDPVEDTFWIMRR
jgi:hypothetical protein